MRPSIEALRREREREVHQLGQAENHKSAVEEALERMRKRREAQAAELRAARERRGSAGSRPPSARGEIS